MGGLLVKNSVSQVSFINAIISRSCIERFPFGNLTYSQSAECSRKVKSEMKYEGRFSDKMVGKLKVACDNLS